MCRNELMNPPSSLLYKPNFSRKLNCWSLRCSWSIACRRCSNYIFILQLIFGYSNWPRYGLRLSGWYCNPEQHELCQALWIIAGSHFYAMEYWPRLSELYLGHIFSLWNTDPCSLNSSLVTFLCYGILTHALWMIAGSHFYTVECWSRVSWVTFLYCGMLIQGLWIIAGSHVYAMEYWPRLSEL